MYEALWRCWLMPSMRCLMFCIHWYFLMRELSEGTSKFIMWCVCLWINLYLFIYKFIHKYAHHIMNFEVSSESSLINKYVCRPPGSASMASTNIATIHDTTLQSIWIENGWNIAQNNCFQGKQSWRLLIIWKVWHYISPLLIPTY